tara:strand:+ start:316 stop:441 length:126 start_codon:yes stop_codon:yes gene_type:complete
MLLILTKIMGKPHLQITIHVYSFGKKTLEGIMKKEMYELEI